MQGLSVVPLKCFEREWGSSHRCVSQSSSVLFLEASSALSPPGHLRAIFVCLRAIFVRLCQSLGSVEHLPWFSGFRKEADWVLISIGLLRGVVSFSFPSLYLPFCSGLANISESGTHSCARKLEVSTSGKLTQLPASFSPGPEQDLGSGRRWPCYPGCSQPVGFSASNLCLGRY